jgi:hypothetical protein
VYYRNKINIKQAIDYVVRSWDEVTATTIVNCWNKTGILPCSIDNNQTEYVVEEPNEQLEINEIISTTTLLSTDFVNQVEDYIKAVDEPLATEENLSEADIVSMITADAMVESDTVLSDTDDHEGNEVVVKPVSNVEALTHLKGLIQFQEQSPDEVFTSDELNILRRKISILEYLIDKAKKQSSLDCYLKK